MTTSSPAQTAAENPFEGLANLLGGANADADVAKPAAGKAPGGSEPSPFEKLKVMWGLKKPPAEK